MIAYQIATIVFIVALFMLILIGYQNEKRPHGGEPWGLRRWRGGRS